MDVTVLAGRPSGVCQESIVYSNDACSDSDESAVPTGAKRFTNCRVTGERPSSSPCVAGGLRSSEEATMRHTPGSNAVSIR